jgi:Bifunctional DNA primase/polymerase, N-terminal
MDIESTAHEWALRFAAAGMPVFPIYWPDAGNCACRHPECSSPAKHPLVPHGVKDATTGSDQIDRWAGLWPAANWAAATGGYTVLDADTLEAHAAFSDAPEPARLIVETGGGGGHHWFRTEHGKSGARTLGDALAYDVRTGRGAYVLLPGSRHITGQEYRILTVGLKRSMTLPRGLYGWPTASGGAVGRSRPNDSVSTSPTPPAATTRAVTNGLQAPAGTSPNSCAGTSGSTTRRCVRR